LHEHVQDWKDCKKPVHDNLKKKRKKDEFLELDHQRTMTFMEPSYNRDLAEHRLWETNENARQKAAGQRERL